MSEERDSQLSAMFDGELPEAECELLARRLGRDAALRARWQRYALIAAAVRAEPGVPLDLGVARRVSSALAADTPAAAVHPGGGLLHSMSERLRGSRWVKPAAGAALAAGVAAMSILYLRAQVPVVGGEALVAQVAQPAPATQAAPVPAARREPESYIVPVAAETATSLAPELANYVVAHSEFSSPLGRRNLLTTLVTADARVAREPEEAR